MERVGDTRHHKDGQFIDDARECAAALTAALAQPADTVTLPVRWEECGILTYLHIGCIKAGVIAPDRRYPRKWQWWVYPNGQAAGADTEADARAALLAAVGGGAGD
jgi:hypothetical protein